MELLIFYLNWNFLLLAVLDSLAVSSLGLSPLSKKLRLCILLISAKVSLWAYQNCDRDKYAVQERGTDGSNGQALCTLKLMSDSAVKPIKRCSCAIEVHQLMCYCTACQQMQLVTCHSLKGSSYESASNWLITDPLLSTLEKEMATHSSVLAWRIPGMGEPGGLSSMGSHRVGHDWSDLAAAAAAVNLSANDNRTSRCSSMLASSLQLHLRS